MRLALTGHRNTDFNERWGMGGGRKAQEVSQPDRLSTGAFCVHCGAWRGCLGQEPAVELFIEHLVLIFDEVRRVLRPDGVLFVNIGDSYAGSGKGPTGHNGIGDQTTRQGFTGDGPKRAVGRANGAIPTGGPDPVEARHRTYHPQHRGGSSFPVSRDRRAGRGIRNGTGYELHEPVAMPECKPKDLMLVPERLMIAMQAAGWWVRSKIVWEKTAPMPESVSDRPSSAWEPILVFTKSRRYFWDKEATRTAPARPPHTHRGGGSNGKAGNLDASGRVASGGWSISAPVRIVNPAGAAMRNVWAMGPEPARYEYCCRCDSFFLGPERTAIVKRKHPDGSTERICPTCRAPGDWVDHFAGFVTELPRRAILAATSEHGACSACGAPWVRSVERKSAPPEMFTRRSAPTDELTKSGSRVNGEMVGQGSKLQAWRDANPSITTGWQPTCRCDAGDPVPCVVLDIFLGTGTTSLAAKHLGRRSIGIELSPRYGALARRRIELDVPKWARPVRTTKRRTPRPAQPMLLEVGS